MNTVSQTVLGFLLISSILPDTSTMPTSTTGCTRPLMYFTEFVQRITKQRIRKPSMTTEQSTQQILINFIPMVNFWIVFHRGVKSILVEIGINCKAKTFNFLNRYSETAFKLNKASVWIAHRLNWNFACSVWWRKENWPGEPEENPSNQERELTSEQNQLTCTCDASKFGYRTRNSRNKKRVDYHYRSTLKK